MRDSGMLLAQVLNGITLGAILAVVGAAVLVGYDAWRRGSPRAEALRWALLTLALLPIGAGLYLFLGRWTERPGRMGDE